MSVEETSASPPRSLSAFAALLSLSGVAVSIELTRIHLFVHTDPSYHSVCAMSEGVNCETVAASPYSVFADLPVSVWGLFGYLAMGYLALWSCKKDRYHPAWPFGLLSVLAVASVLISAVLAFISATRIDSICLFCSASYLINAVMLVVCGLALRRSRVQASHLLVQDLKELAERPRVLLSLTAVGVLALALLLTSFPTYWKTPGWRDLPQLASGTSDGGHHYIGARDPGLTIVEFSDYECPHCRAAHKAMRVVAAKHPAKIRLIHRQLPLDMACHPGLKRPFHRHACRLAEAAECAGLQGRFWEMNDALFSIQERVKAKDVDPVDLAVRIGLNRSDFKQCLEQHTTARRVAEDIQQAIGLKLRGTPSFLIGERLFLGRVPEEEINRLLTGEQ